MRESGVLRQAWLAVAHLTTLFRVNTGQAWLSGAGPAQRQPDGSVVLHAARPVALGLGMPDGKALVGASDLLGWTSVNVTPQMVGTRIAVFTAIETKATDGGHRRSEQINFVERLKTAGGIAGFANGAAVAQSIIADWCSARGIAIKEQLR